MPVFIFTDWIVTGNLLTGWCDPRIKSHNKEQFYKGTYIKMRVCVETMYLNEDSQMKIEICYFPRNLVRSGYWCRNINFYSNIYE